MNLDYLKKTEKALNEDIFWNIPEQKTGIISIIGGNSNNFSFEIKQAEFLNTLNLKEVRLILPDSLKSKVPPVPGVNFTPATESGSFDKSSELNFALSDSDLTLLSGDFSKNSATSIAILNAIKNSEKPVVLSRDAIDLISESAEEIIEREGLIFVASMSQLQKLFRNLLYPKMLLLGAPLLPVVETLHKFTLSYPATILTFHQGNILVASSGEVIATPIDATNYSPISLFMSNLASKIATLNLWNPKKYLESTHSALFYNS
ncbi:hypothetical protein IJI76_00845 [Candidatus Saccharibacteria bacterium]|nr:hypothetical protein [Candidatus Saccharibacteria bacterium]